MDRQINSIPFSCRFLDSGYLGSFCSSQKILLGVSSFLLDACLWAIFVRISQIWPIPFTPGEIAKAIEEKEERKMRKIAEKGILPPPEDLAFGLCCLCFFAPLLYALTFASLSVHNTAIFTIFLCLIWSIFWIGVPIHYRIMNHNRAKYWMWTIRCSQCGYEGEAIWGWQREKCPSCSWDHVIRLGWRRRN